MSCPRPTSLRLSRGRRRCGSWFYRSAAIGGVVSSIGIGTYLGECTAEDDAGYTDAIDAAISSGVNLIDTAINYRCQRSERAVGAAIQRAIARGVPRNAIVISTKGGYVPFDGNFGGAKPKPGEIRAWFQSTWVASGVMRADELIAGCHCMTPRFLENQLSVTGRVDAAQQHRRADGGVARERNFDCRGEDAQPRPMRSVHGWQHEYGLREVQLARGALHQLGAETRAVGEYRHRVALERDVGEDVGDHISVRRDPSKALLSSERNVSRSSLSSAPSTSSAHS